jgi:small subunit ribosomal protein S1
MDKEPVAETPPDTGTSGTSSDMMSLSLETPPSQTEESSVQSEKESSNQRRDTKGERRERQERTTENPLLNNLPLSDEGETTAMAEAFRAAARQRTKEEAEETLE